MRYLDKVFSYSTQLCAYLIACAGNAAIKLSNSISVDGHCSMWPLKPCHDNSTLPEVHCASLSEVDFGMQSPDTIAAVLRTFSQYKNAVVYGSTFHAVSVIAPSIGSGMMPLHFSARRPLWAFESHNQYSHLVHVT